MKIIIRRDCKKVTELNGIDRTAKYLGWPKQRTLKVLNSGGVYQGISLEISNVVKRGGIVVLAYTSDSVQRFTSVRECCRVFNISRSKLDRLINEGSTHSDGRTTFDIPCDPYPKEENNEQMG